MNHSSNIADDAMQSTGGNFELSGKIGQADRLLGDRFENEQGD
jgi:hypothetical protein